MNNPLFDIYEVSNFSLQQAAFEDARHVQRRFEMIWLIAGHGEHRVGTETLTLQPFHIYCIIPDTEHRISLEPNARGFIMSFNGMFLETAIESSGVLKMPAFHRLFLAATAFPTDEESAEEITDLLTLLLKEHNRRLASRSDMLPKYFQLFLEMFSRLLRQNEVVPGRILHTLVDRFLVLLEENFRERLSVTEYAKFLFVTPNHLNHVIKSTTGQTARQHIQQRVLLEAKTALRHKGASMKQIAYQLGFDDLGHFSKFFKSTAGKNFTTYRKQIVHQFA